MDVIPPLIVSPVLRGAAELKADELQRVKEAFECRYHLKARRSTETNTAARVNSLIKDVSRLNPELVDEDDLEIMRRYVDQAQDDRSVSESKILKFEERIRSDLNKHLHRLEVSTLHIDLMNQVMNTDESAPSVAAKPDKVDFDDGFEVVENELDEVLESFEKETFTAGEVETEAIKAYLSNVFSLDSSLLEDIREELVAHSEEIEADGVEIDQDFLMWCILSLLKNDSIAENQKRILQGYLQSPIALQELVSTINAKSVRSWEYKNAHNGLPVKAHQNLEGQHCITIEESIIDMLFLHSIGYGWAMRLKTSLEGFVRRSQSFDHPRLSSAEANKREYFLGRNPAIPVPEPAMQPIPTVCTLCHPYYPSAPMPPPPPMDFGSRRRTTPPPPPPPPPPQVVVIDHSVKKKKFKPRRSWVRDVSIPADYGSMLAWKRRNKYTQDFFMSRLPTLEGCTPKVAPLEEVQAKLMKTLAAESKLRVTFDGLVYAGSAKLESLASSVPHKTIMTVLEFLGVSEVSLSLFERFLSTKLNIGPAVRGAPDRVLPRARGVPDGHALEIFFLEAILFMLELVVRQKTGSYLYRLKDNCYFVGNYDQHETFEAEVTEFAEIMGLDVSFKQTLAIGLLDFTTPMITVEDSKVGAYARGIKRQLSACNTVLDWVRVWNNTAGTYAAHLFGPLADVFGKSHLEAVRRAYKLIFEIVLDGGSLTTHVRNLLVTHAKCPFTELSSLEAFIYLPRPYGGLGVKNPFITLKLAHELRNKPDEIITEYLEMEEEYYNSAARNWSLLPADAHARKIEAIFNNDSERIAASLGASRDFTAFMTKDELTEHRERASYPVLPFPPPPALYLPTLVPSLGDIYDDLLHEPNDDISSSDKVRDDVRRLAGKGDMRSWNKLSGEDKWVLQLYGDECFDKYGGLELWVGEFVPQQVLKAIRGGSWDDCDDESSYLSEP